MSVLSTVMAYYPYVFHPIVLVGGGLLVLIIHEWRLQDAPRSALIRRIGAFLCAGVLSLAPTGAFVLVTGNGPFQLTQGNGWRVDTLVGGGILVVCLVLWVVWRRYEWGSVVPGGLLALAVVTVPYVGLSTVWNVSGHVILAVAPTLYLTLVDAKFWPLLVVPAVMIPNRVFVEAHTWSQSIAGAVLAGAVVACVYAVRRNWDWPRRTDRTAG